MYRRHFLSLVPFAALSGLSFKSTAKKSLFSASSLNAEKKNDARKYWVDVMVKLADPVLLNLSEGKLKANMPVEVNPTSTLDRSKVTYLEAFGRLIAGIAPWLELGGDETPEGKLRAKYIALTHKSLAKAVDPASPDYMQFSDQKYEQALVDASFLAQGLIRGTKQLWEPLDQHVKENVIKALKATRNIKPTYNNWLLFMGMIEAFLLKIGEDYDIVRLDYGIKKHLEWYKGDGIYGDGPNFHFDYYNSYVIQPMMMDVMEVMVDKGKETNELYKTVTDRAVRYAAIQERQISPEGTFPPVGRSLAYRFGAMQGLSQMALLKKLPADVKPAQVREALTLVIRRMIEAPGTFDKNGWLKIGFCGHQIDMGESYISTGSLYLCSTGLLPLGLPANDSFWMDPAVDWTSKKLWNGVNLMADHAAP